MTRNAREVSARNSLVGSRIGKFDVIAEIGTGGMASVYLARSTAAGGFNRLVAIKVMHPHLSNEDSFVEMFLDEARVAATIQHPNVVSIIDVGIEEGLIFLVMEYVEGDSFSAVEKMAVNLRRRIPLGIILRVVLDALAGLQYAHELRDHDGTPLRIVHRDVSPQNVMVGVDGIARIVDFGIAKAESRITNTQVGLIKGKINFMAPEQIRGTSLDRRVDVFGMGVTLWEAVTLRRLFAGENEFDTARRILAGEYPTLHSYDPKLPPVLDAICQRALHPDPDQRFLTCEEFALTIEHELRTHIAAPREVSAFIGGVATQKLDRERRAVRENANSAPPDEPDAADDDEDMDVPGFMTTTVVQYPAATGPAVEAISAILPSTSAPRDRSKEESSTIKRSQFRAPTMTMPSRGSSKNTPPARPAAVVSSGDRTDPGASTRSLRVPPGAAADAPGAHEDYDDDGATSPFHSMALVAHARAIREGMAIAPAPTSSKRPAVFEDEGNETESGSARTLFQPQFIPAKTDTPSSSGKVVRAPTLTGPPAQTPAEQSAAFDLIQRRVDPVPQAEVGTAPAAPYVLPTGMAPYAPPPQVQFPPIPRDPPGITGAYAQQKPAGGLPAMVYVLLSLVLLGGAGAVLWYVLQMPAS